MSLLTPVRAVSQKIVSIANALPSWFVLTLGIVPIGIAGIVFLGSLSSGLAPALSNALKTWLGTAFPYLVISLLRWKKQIPILAITLLSLSLAALAILRDIHLNYAAASTSFAGEIPSIGSYYFKLFLIGILGLIPPILTLFYRASGIFDRYVIRSVGTPLLICTFGFVAIWFIIDLADNVRDFNSAGVGLGKILHFYSILVPQIIVQTLPVSALLALLYSISKLSKHNEISSMLGSGHSVTRVLRPCFVIGVLLSIVSLVLSYDWAPRAEGHKESILRALSEGEKDQTLAHRQLYRNRIDKRTWYIGSVPYNSTEMNRIWIIQQDQDDNMLRSISAEKISWDSETGHWTLHEGKIVEYNDQGIPLKTNFFLKSPTKTHTITDWSETPWKIYSSTLEPEFLSVPELSSFLKTNHTLPKEQLAPYQTYWNYRFASPWACLVVVLVAAPLGIVSSRRGVLGGVAAAVFIFFAIFFFDNLFLAMGLGNRISPLAGAWLTNLLFGSIGLYLLWLRSRNREGPSLRMLTNLFRSSAKA